MDHADHVALVQAGVVGRLWADFGAGDGAFTLALAQCLPPNSMIYAIDRDGGALARAARRLSAQFPYIDTHIYVADFTHALELPPLDGIVMANALHFLPDKPPTLHRLYNYLRPGGRLIVVEYDTDRGNSWVPYPFSYATWVRMADSTGFVGTRQLARRPSRFLGSFYSALSWRPDAGHEA